MEVFNNESIEDYLGRLYLVVTGKVSSTELPCKKTFLNISFKEERNFIKFTMNLITNSFMLPDTLLILRHLFRLLLRQFSNDVLEAKTFLRERLRMI